jgi:hypothetical protein
VTNVTIIFIIVIHFFATRKSQEKLKISLKFFVYASSKDDHPQQRKNVKSQFFPRSEDWDWICIIQQKNGESKLFLETRHARAVRSWAWGRGWKHVFLGRKFAGSGYEIDENKKELNLRPHTV